jgi:hypothetical protein
LNEYAVFGDVYLYRTLPKDEGHLNYAVISEGKFDTTGLTEVHIVPGRAYYNEFLTAKGATELSKKPGTNPQDLAEGSVFRIKTNQKAYRDVAKKGAKQPERFEEVGQLPPDVSLERRKSTEHHSIAFDSAAHAGQFAGVASYQFNLTCSGSNRLLIFGDSRYTGSENDYNVTAVTYNGDALTEIRKDTAAVNANFHACLWYRIAPDTGGSYTVAVTYSGVVVAGDGGAVNYTGVNQSSPLDVDGSNDSSGGTHPELVLITTVNNAWVFGVAIIHVNTAPYPTPDLNDRWSGSNYYAGEDTGPVTPAGSQSIGWTTTGTISDWLVDGVSFISIIPPTVTTQAASDITANTATGNGNITAVGDETPDERGFEWGTSPGVYPNSVTETGTFGTGAFDLPLTSLPYDTTIYYRAKAHSDAGWGYGSEVTFDTLTPDPETKPATNIQANQATGNGYSDFDFTEVGFEWGLVSGGPYPNVDSQVISGSGAFSLNMTGMPADTTIYFRARIYADGYGYTYGSELSFDTTEDIPVVVTAAPSSVTETTATLNGRVTSTGGDAECDETGFVWDTSSHSNPGNVAPAASGYGSSLLVSGHTVVEDFQWETESLTQNKIYYVRAFAHNSYGYSYGAQILIITNPNVEILYPVSQASLGVRFDSSYGGGYPHPYAGSVPHYQLVLYGDAAYHLGGTWGYLSGHYIYERNYYNENFYTDLYNLSNPVNQAEGWVKVKWKSLPIRIGYAFGQYKRELKTHGTQYTGSTLDCDTSGDVVCELFPNNPNTSGPWVTDELNNLVAGISLGNEGSFGIAACGLLLIYALRADAQVKTIGATDLGGSDRRLHGEVVEDEAEDCTVYFEWGETTAYGNTTAGQTKAKGDSFTADIDIGVLTDIHFRTVIETACGETFYGNDATFPAAPTGAGLRGSLANKLAGGGFI